MIRGDKNDLTKSDTGLTENQSVNPVTIYRNTYIRQTGKGRMLPMMLQKQNKDGSTNIKMGIEE